MNNGDIYFGEFWRNCIHGNGLLVSASNDYYEGQFAANRKNGPGILKYANGDVYKGGFVDDLQQGENCEFCDAKAEEIYYGPFIKGKKHGKGKLRNKAGNEREVEYFRGKLVDEG